MKASRPAEGTLKSMTAAADLSSRLSVRGSAAGPLQASVHLSGLPYAPAGSIQAHGTLDGAPLDLDAAMDRGADRTFRLLVRHAQWKSATANGDVASDSNSRKSRGQLHLDVEQLGDFSRLLGADVAAACTAVSDSCRPAVIRRRIWSWMARTWPSGRWRATCRSRAAACPMRSTCN